MSTTTNHWVEDERGALLIQRTSFDQSDGMPKPEDVVLGGIDIENQHVLGWISYLHPRNELYRRWSIDTAKMDVEAFLKFKGLLPESFSFSTTSTLLAHEKVS